MSGICDTCMRKSCPAECEGLRRCDFYKGGETRYERLFGTPERAARTMIDKQLTYDVLDQCDECPHQTDECFEPSGKCAMQEHDALLEWLRGDA